MRVDVAARPLASVRPRSPHAVVGALAAAGALFVTAPPAEACTCRRPCCGQVWVTPQGDRIPSNVPGFSWWPGPSSEDGCVSATATADDVRLFHLTGGVELPVPLSLTADGTGYLVRPMEALAVGGRYRFVGGSLCARTERFGSSARPVTFEVGNPVPVPTSLGTLAVAAPRVGTLPVRSLTGGCLGEVIAVAAEVTVQHTPDAQSWAPMFLYETLVDGMPWAHVRSLCDQPAHGASVYGRGRDLVYAVCVSDDRTVERTLSPGRHTVRFRATLPGSSTPIDSQPIEVDLRCDAPPADTGSALPDAGTVDAGGVPVAPPLVAPGGCHVTPAQQARSAGWLVALAGLLFTARRRKAGRSRR